MKKTLWINLIISSTLLLNSLCFAQDSVLLHQNDKAPYDGILLTQDKAQDVKNKLLEGDSYKLLNDSLNKSLNLQADIITKDDNKINLCMDQNDKLAKSLQSSTTMSDWEKVGYFLVGVFATAAAIYGAHQIYK